MAGLTQAPVQYMLAGHACTGTSWAESLSCKTKTETEDCGGTLIAMSQKTTRREMTSLQRYIVPDQANTFDLLAA